MMILVVLRFGTAMAVIDEYLIFGGFNRDSPTYTWTIFMYDQAFKLGLWRQGFAAAIGMIGAVAMMFVMVVLLRIFRPEGLTHDGRQPLDSSSTAPSCHRERHGAELVPAQPQRHHPPRGDQLLHGDHHPAAALGAADVGEVAPRRDAGPLLADASSTSPATATSSRRSTRCRSISSTASTSPPARCCSPRSARCWPAMRWSTSGRAAAASSSRCCSSRSISRSAWSRSSASTRSRAFSA